MANYKNLGDHRPHNGDIMVSYLPLAHMLERCCENGIFYSGAAVGFYTGNIRDLTNDLKALKPTIMPTVPRLFNRVYDNIQNEISSSPLKRILFKMALKSKESELHRQILRKNTIWDKLVFRKIQDCKYHRIFFKTIILCKPLRILRDRNRACDYFTLSIHTNYQRNGIFNSFHSNKNTVVAQVQKIVNK